MHLSLLTRLAIIATLFACHDGSFNREASRASSEENQDFGPKPELQSGAEEDKISIPASITGAYLFCQKLAVDPAAKQQAIGCRVEENGVVVDDFKNRVESYSWSYDDAELEISVKEEASEDWLTVFEIRPKVEAVKSQLSVELSFVFDGVETKIQTEFVLIWDEDCALAVIDFENLDRPNIPLGSTVSEQYFASHGVRFSTLSGAPVLLAAYEVPEPVAYFGGPDNTENFLAPNQNAGKLFITDGHKQSVTTDTIVIEYAKPAKEASMDVIDIDFSETYILQAFNAQNELVDEFQLQSDTTDFRDGQLTRFVVRSPEGQNEISKLHIHGFNANGGTGIGFGIDNFSPRCIQQ